MACGNISERGLKLTFFSLGNNKYSVHKCLAYLTCATSLYLNVVYSCYCKVLNMFEFLISLQIISRVTTALIANCHTLSQTPCYKSETHQETKIKSHADNPSARFAYLWINEQLMECLLILYRWSSVTLQVTECNKSE